MLTTRNLKTTRSTVKTTTVPDRHPCLSFLINEGIPWRILSSNTSKNITSDNQTRMPTTVPVAHLLWHNTPNIVFFFIEEKWKM